MNLWSTLSFLRFEKLNISDFWDPLKLLKPSKKVQILDSWPLDTLSMPKKLGIGPGLYRKSVLYLLFHLVYDLLSSVFATRKGKSHFWWPCQITRGLVGKMSLLNIWWCLVGNKSAFRPAIRLESAFSLRLIKIGRIFLVNE